MQRLFIAAALLSGLIIPASATDQNITLTASVTGYCTVAGSLSPSDDLQTIQAPGGIVDPTPIVRTYAVVCNSAADVALTSINGAMISGVTPLQNFDNFINYSAGTTGFVAIAPASTSSGATPAQVLGTATTSGAESGDLTVTISPIPSQPLLAGTYADTLKVSIIPQI